MNLNAIFGNKKKSGNNDCFILFDIQTNKCLFVSASIKYKLGYRNTEVIGKGISFFKKIIDSEDYATVISDLTTYILPLNLQDDPINYKPKRLQFEKVKIRLKEEAISVFNIDVSFLKINDSTAILAQLERVENYKAPTKKISKREQEVLKHIGSGDSSKIIAQKLNISETTVITHRKNLIQKLQVQNTAELIKHAVKHNLID